MVHLAVDRRGIYRPVSEFAAALEKVVSRLSYAHEHSGAPRATLELLLNKPQSRKPCFKWTNWKPPFIQTNRNLRFTLTHGSLETKLHFTWASREPCNKKPIGSLVWNKPIRSLILQRPFFTQVKRTSCFMRIIKSLFICKSQQGASLYTSQQQANRKPVIGLKM